MGHVRASEVVIKKTLLGAVKNQTLTNEVENVSGEFKVICHIQSQWCTQKYILGGVTRHRKTKEGIACWAPKQYMSFFFCMHKFRGCSDTTTPPIATPLIATPSIHLPYSIFPNTSNIPSHWYNVLHGAQQCDLGKPRCHRYSSAWCEGAIG